MIDKLKNLVNKKMFHIIVISVIILILLFILGMTILKYEVEGETNMPFNLTKIAIISTSEGIDKESQSKWAFDIDQNNDFYLYIEKNENYEKTETIKSVTLNNFNVTKNKDIGETKIYKPDATTQVQFFTNSEENSVEQIEYIGGSTSDFKSLQISNQGDVLAFRYANKNVSSYESNDDESINHSELLKKSGLQLDDIKSTVSFDITIALDSGKEFKTNISLDVPTQDIIEEGSCSAEITDLSNFIFKRVKN